MILHRFFSNLLFFSFGIAAKCSDDGFSFLLMGDPQFHFMCEEDNVQCKHVSKRCRDQYNLSSEFERNNGTKFNETIETKKQMCIRIESRFSNRVQRQAIDTFLKKLDHIPAALIINGDLTDFGHLPQLKEFKNTWYNNFPIPLLLGLGNHDYQNNVNDCVFNFCAHTMLSWYADYVKNRSLVADFQRKSSNGFEVTYTGSLAYTERACSKSQKSCAFVVQLNNAIDYKVYFSSVFVDWNLTSPIEYLVNELSSLKNTKDPILLNMHKCGNLQFHKIKTILSHWIKNEKGNDEINDKSNSSFFDKQLIKVGVFYAHIHQRHEVHIHCIHGHKIPFVYVGSVPNNRFSWLKIINGTNAIITGYKAKDSLMYNGNVLEELESISLWGFCTKNEHHIFVDSTTKKRWIYLKQNEFKTPV